MLYHEIAYAMKSLTTQCKMMPESTTQFHTIIGLNNSALSDILDILDTAY